jgi:hypothetical protein
MRSSATKRKDLVATFNHPMQVTVRRGEFEPIESIGLLDKKKLSRGSHKVHIGSVSGGCCPSKVYASVRGGQVVHVHVEPCSGHPGNSRKKKLTKEAQAIISEAKRRGHLKAKRGKGTPVPVDRFFSSPRQMAIIVSSEWDNFIGCATVCWEFGDKVRRCVFCCAGEKGEVTCLGIDYVFED